MTKKMLKIALWMGLGLLLLALVSWIALPHLVAALPSRYRLYLPEPVLKAVSAPLPTALPAPALAPAVAAAPPILPTPTAVPTDTPTITPTPRPNETAVPTATATPFPTATPSPTPLPEQAHISGLQIVPQKFNNCGPANLSLLLDFYDHPTPQLDIAAVIRPLYDDRNVSPHELAAYVNEQTPLQATVYSGGNLPLLKQLLANGFPVIIEKGLVPAEWQGWMGHYLTLIGYDDAAQTFTTLDTYLGPWDSSGLAEGYDYIAEHWQHFNYTFVLVYPPEEAAAIQAILGPTFADEPTMWQTAVQTAQQEIATTPENAFAWFNLGSSLMTLSRLTGQADYGTAAAAAFDQARILGLPWRMLWYQFEPYEAYLANGRTEDVLTLVNATLSSSDLGLEESYYYRGLAYAALGENGRARTDLRQALEQNPHFTPAQTALDALE